MTTENRRWARTALANAATSLRFALDTGQLTARETRTALLALAVLTGENAEKEATG